MPEPRGNPQANIFDEKHNRRDFEDKSIAHYTLLCKVWARRGKKMPQCGIFSQSGEQSMIATWHAVCEAFYPPKNALKRRKVIYRT